MSTWTWQQTALAWWAIAIVVAPFLFGTIDAAVVVMAVPIALIMLACGIANAGMAVWHWLSRP